MIQDIIWLLSLPAPYLALCVCDAASSISELCLSAGTALYLVGLVDSWLLLTAFFKVSFPTFIASMSVFLSVCFTFRFP